VIQVFSATRVTRYIAAIIASFAIMLSAVQATAERPQTTDEDADSIRITLLGTGTPPTSTTQFGASTLIEAGGHALLFDCGRGCGIRLMQARPALYNRINRLFLTHMHSDHMVGVADVYMNGWLLGRSDTFHAYGPVGTRHYLEGLHAAFEPDIRTRNVLENFPPDTNGLNLQIRENVGDGIVFDDDGVRVTAFLVDHAGARPAYGYRVDYDGRSVLLSGDTKLSPNLEAHAQDVDVIIHEVIPTSLIERLDQLYPPQQVAGIVAHHTRPDEVGQLLSRIAPRLAVYSHYLSAPDSDARLLEETARYWDGAVIAGQDLTSIEIGVRQITVCEPDQSCRTIDETEWH